MYFALIFTLLLRPAFPQAGHTSLGHAELKDGMFFGSITYSTSDWLGAVAHWYKADFSKTPRSNLEVYERNYFKNFFRVWIGQVQVPLDSLGRTEEGDKVTYTFAFRVGEAQELVIDHRVIFHLYSDQTHSMTFRMFGKERSYVFKESHPTFFAKSRP